tara:strand:- start:102 stop:2528 length:2427 start_codon:yes stop_codon:yes gene_type:complete
MAKVTTELQVLVKTAGDAGLDKLTRTLNGLGRQAKSAAAPFDQISKELKDVQRTSKNSIANLRGYRNAWRDITEQVEIGSAAFKEATAEAARLDKQLQKAEGRKGGGGRFRAGAQIAGTIAGAGVFGGVEGAAGAGVGALLGGTGGAIVGGAIGAQVGQLRQALGAVAEYGAELTKLRIALRGVTQSEQEYAKALLVVNQATKDFAIPQSLVTKQFTKLQASVSGAGGNLADTTKTFRGIIAAVRATGGSLQDVDSALTATAQVFSKGKVSAEELRQQIGERLPGAFTLFAKSAGLSTKELDKALEGGKVTLQDFLRFSEDLFERYGETAQIIASGPEGAGDRLKVALEKLNEAVAPELSRLGAQFQTFATNAANSLVDLFDKLGEIDRAMSEKLGGKLIDNQRRTLEQAKRTILDPAADDLAINFAKGVIARLTPIVQRFDFIGPPVPDAPSQLDTEDDKDLNNGDPSKLSKFYGQAQSEFNKFVKELERGDKVSLRLLTRATQNNALLNTRNELEQINTKFTIDTSNVLQKYQNILAGNLRDEARINIEKARGLELTNLEIQKREDLKEIFEAAGTDFANFAIKQNKELSETDLLFKQIETTLSTSLASGIQGLIDGAKSLKEVFSDILKQLASVFLQAAVKSAVGGLFPSKDGNVIAQNKIVPYAAGGVVNKPTIFPMANGMGVMGEAGPEAIMPLKRGPSGRLGVEMTNQGSARDAMNRYSRRNSGSSSGDSIEGEGELGSGSQAVGPIDVRYTVERINSVDYVTADQFQSGMQRAAEQGAKQGEQSTLKRLQMSGSTRKRLGL